LVVAILTIGFAFGLPKLRVEIDLLSWLPSKSPNVEAFATALESLRGVSGQEMIWLELDPGKVGSEGPKEITDHAAVLAQIELVDYLRARVPECLGDFGLSGLTRVSKWEMSGAKTPPGPISRFEWMSMWLVVSRDPTIGRLIRPLIGKEGQGTILPLVLDAEPLSEQAKQLATKLKLALEEYRGDDSVKHDYFRDEYLVPAGLTSGTAVIEETLREDILRLTPIALVVVVVLLTLLLRNLRAVVTVCATLLVASVWTFGLMGFLGTSIDIVTVALVPFVLGVGVNYVVFVTLEAAESREGGADESDVFRRVSASSVRAIALTSLTTASGLLVLVFSGSSGLFALGLHGGFGVLCFGALAILVIPVFVGGRRGVSPPGSAGQFAARWQRLFSRYRILVLLATVVATAAAAPSFRDPDVELDVIGGNYPPGSAILKATERMRERCGGAFPEFVIVEGDLESAPALALADAIRERSEKDDELSRFTTFGFADLLRLRSALRRLRGGAEEAGDVTAASLYADPYWKPLASSFIDRRGKVGTVLYLGGDAGSDFDAVGGVWNALERATQDVPPALDVSFLGFRTMTFLFLNYAFDWMRIAATVSLVVVLVLALLFLRDFRILAITLVCVVLSGTLWFGALDLAGVYVSVFLLFPLIFVLCTGSDYVLHLLCRHRFERRNGSTDALGSTWRTAGRAVTMAALTDAGVFLVFTRMQLVSTSSVMIAIAIAVGVAWILAQVLLPAVLATGVSRPRVSQVSDKE
ncbi:MAG: MMPL family transporter, partial [Planctomycetota bacterium]